MNEAHLKADKIQRLKTSNRGSKNTAVRDARIASGLSQLDLAVLANVSIGSISLTERSGRMTSSMAQKLADVLGISVARLTRPR